MRKGISLRGIEIVAYIGSLRFFSEHYRAGAEMTRGDAGYADAGRFDGQYFIDLFPVVQARPLFSHPVYKVDVDLMIQKIIHL